MLSQQTKHLTKGNAVNLFIYLYAYYYTQLSWCRNKTKHLTKGNAVEMFIYLYYAITRNEYDDGPSKQHSIEHGSRHTHTHNAHEQLGHCCSLSIKTQAIVIHVKNNQFEHQNNPWLNQHTDDMTMLAANTFVSTHTHYYYFCYYHYTVRGITTLGKKDYCLRWSGWYACYHL